MKALFLIISFLFTVSIGYAVNPNGTWKSTEKSAITLVLQTNGENLSGTIEDSHGKQTIPETKISNNEFSFSLEVPEFDVMVKYDCTVNEEGTILVKVTEPGKKTNIVLQKQ